MVLQNKKIRMRPGSFILCVLLAVLGQCLSDQVQDEIQILKEIFQNETTYNGEDGCEAVDGSIDSCVDCYPCGHAVIMAARSLKEIKEIRIRKGADCLKDPYLDLCCVAKGTELGKRFAVRSNHATCGMRQRSGAVVPRFGAVDIEDTLFGEFSWVVVILINCDGRGWEYSCVGTLINSRAVLTAAHCVCGLERQKCIVRIRAGEHKFSTDMERFPHVEVDVLKVIKHNNFYEPGLHNDIALLILKNPIEQMPHIGFACLADGNMEPDPAQNCVMAGWGIKIPVPRPRHPPRRRDIMRSIQMSLLEREDCQNRMRSGPFGPGYNLHESFRCAIGAEGQDVFTGDGGAALVCPLPGEQDRYAQYGIVALGRTNGVPSLFTDTTKYRHWVDLNVEQNIQDTITDSYIISV